jgi:hypothetical protein
MNQSATSTKGTKTPSDAGTMKFPLRERPGPGAGLF